MTYPGLLTFPSESLFPSDVPGPPLGGYAQSIQVELGDLVLTATDAFGVDWLADTLTGWYGSPSSTIQLTQKPRAPGAWSSTSRQFTPRIITLAGAVYAPTPAALTDALNRLNAAASLNDTTLTVTENGVALLAIVARQDVVLTNRLSDYAATFSVQLVAADPRKFLAPLTATTRLPASSGGLIIPFAIPFDLSATSTSGMCALTNPGNITGPVKLRIDGPTTGPIVTHIGSGLALVFAASLTLASGDWIDIDMEAQTVLINGQNVSRNAYVTQRGWSGFEPGLNEWDFSAVTYNAATLLTVTAAPAYE
jgi:hypothetical protein